MQKMVRAQIGPVKKKLPCAQVSTRADVTMNVKISLLAISKIEDISGTSISLLH